MAKSKVEPKERPVVVCTNKRGVFFGYLAPGTRTQNADGTLVKGLSLLRARMCQYWSAATKGVLGLAATGPVADSRIGPQVPRLEVDGIDAVVDCTEAAVTAWEAAAWQS